MINPTESNCCGCRACENACPKNCVSMIKNANGFLIPQVDQDSCVNCGACERVCPIGSSVQGNVPRTVLASYSKDDGCDNSASGGIFYSLAKQTIKNGGVVFGAAFNSKLYCEHKSAETESELEPLQGSKYVQSDTADSYELVHDYLGKDRNVLFSGTPCQIAGLEKSLVGGLLSRKNLLTVEIVCHGVYSPQMWSDYIKWLEKRLGSQVEDYKFRTKKAHGRDFRCSVVTSDGQEKIVSGFKDPYYKTYMAGTSMREICYECPYARKERVADITVGDFWNIEDVDIGFGKRDRVSVVLLNTDKGMEAWNEIKAQMDCKETSLEMAVKGNGNLQSVSHKPSSYFPYGDVTDKEAFFDEASQKPGNRKKELFNMLPPMVRRRMKKIM